MTAQEQVSKLQGLLARIKRNAAKPRGTAAASTAQPAPERPFDFAAAAAPPPPAPPAPPPTPPVVSAADQSIDELLAQPSPPQPDVEVALESFAPPPPAVASEAPDAEPIPLVSVATAQPEPPAAAADEAFALESEVSEVRITTGMREDVEVTVAAIEAEAEPIGTEELSDDDLIEVTEATPAPSAGTSSDLDIDFEDEEQPPASSQRKVATSMDEALAAAADQLESDREVPIKTPPPESGPQEAPAPQPMPAPAAPDVDALLGGELDIPTREAPPPGPTAEQLGQTIDLDEARGPQLELAEPAASAPPTSTEELEVALPAREVVGSYDDDLLPPPGAREDLEAHRRSLEDDIPPPPESLATLPSVQPAAPPAEIIPVQAAASEPAGPEIVARPFPIGSPESFGSTREAFRPSSFAELLDASLSLSGD